MLRASSLIRSFCLLPALLGAGAVGADVYKYTDKNGHVHLADRAVHSGYRLILRTNKTRYSAGQVASHRRQFRPLVNNFAQLHGLDAALVDAVVLMESAYNPSAKSHAGAVGLMQLMPLTAKRFGVSDRRDPEQNLRAGTRYLSELIERYQGDLRLALAAYNAGETAVARYGGQVPPYKETRNYVRKVLEQFRRNQGPG